MQSKNLANCKIAVLYASAYGNTASLAQTISRGITKAGAGVEMVNLEQASLQEAEAVLATAQGFCIGAKSHANSSARMVNTTDENAAALSWCHAGIASAFDSMPS